MMGRSRVAAVLFALTFLSRWGPAAAGEDLQADLVRLSEQLLEAIRVGDKAALARLGTEDVTLVDRDGKVYSRDEFIDELVPPPEGYDLRFTVEEPKLFHHGDTALLTFLLDEHLTIFGHDVSTKYRNHFLFYRVEGSWKLAMYTYWEKPSTPPRVTVPTAELVPLTGTYELAPGKWTTRIFLEDGKLMSQRGTAAPRELVPMAGERFYIEGVEAEWYFERGPDGSPTALVFRRNWVDLRLARIP
jgi:ketosteroid isomerase-like protein